MILTWWNEIFLLSSSCLLMSWLNFQQIRLAALSWNGEGSFLFTSSSAPYDRNDNGPCDEVALIHLNRRFLLLLIIHELLIYPDGICFILGHSSCANWEEPQGWYPSKSWKCGIGIWWLYSKIGWTLYILYRVQYRIARDVFNLGYIVCY